MNPLCIITGILIGLPIPDEMIRSSVDKGIKRLETSATNYAKNRSCFSCHHQALPVMALSAAKERGFKIGDEIVAKQIEFSLPSFEPRLKDIRDGTGLGGGNTHAVYALQTLLAAHYPPDEITRALVEYLLKRQKENGSWTPVTQRVPSQGSPFTDTALALQALKHFGGLDRESTDVDRSKRLRQANEKGLQFLLAGKAASTEDRVFRLWGFVAGKAKESEIREAKEDLLKQQRADGGWGQLDDMNSDAYATGSALAALHMAGISSKKEAYRRGVRFLVLSQHESGGWLVQTRSRPLQVYFDNGDPGGKSQFIGITATGWAVVALAAVFEIEDDANPKRWRGQY